MIDTCIESLFGLEAGPLHSGLPRQQQQTCVESHMPTRDKGLMGGCGSALPGSVVRRILQPSISECSTLRIWVWFACCQPYKWFMLSVYSNGVAVDEVADWSLLTTPYMAQVCLLCRPQGASLISVVVLAPLAAGSCDTALIATAIEDKRCVCLLC